MSENEEFIREFLEECAESLDQLDKDLVALETDPHNARLLDNIFRTIHTIKGTSGFFGFSKLGAVAHDGESLLGRLRDGELVLTQEIATALLKLVDAIRTILANVGDSGGEGTGDFQGLSAELIRLALSPGVQAMLEPTTTVAAVTAPAADVPPSEPVETEPSADVSPSHGEPPATLPPTTESDSEALPALSPAPDVSVVTSDKAPSPVDRGAPPRLATRDAAPVTTSEGSIRVDVGLLDELVDLAGELVLAHNQLNQLGAASDNRALLNTIQKLNLITSELQEGVMQARMQPIATIWGKFPRLVRDLAVGCQKEVRLEQFGEDTELDRSLLEAIRDPLTHLIRNAVDHGIEPPHVRESRGKPRPGRVLLRAYHESGQVHLEITDDGGGIDLQRIRQRALDHDLISAQQADAMSDQELSQLIFLPGFSTAEKVTAVSGRGVGMDVVRTNIERIGGSIELQNRPGLGTTVRITIPLTLAIIPALIVICQGESFAIPEVAVTELLSVPAESAAHVVESVHGAPVYRLRGQLLPLVYLSQNPAAVIGGTRGRPSEHRGAADRWPLVWAGGRRSHQHSGNRRQADGSIHAGHSGLRRGDHHGRRNGCPDPRRHGPEPSEPACLRSKPLIRRRTNRTPRVCPADPWSSVKWTTAGGLPSGCGTWSGWRSFRWIGWNAPPAKRWCNMAVRSCR